MTNDTRHPVAPIEGHYAMLRNGEISLNHIPYFRKNSPCAWECPTSGAKWLADGKSYNGRHLDIIATISPDVMAVAFDLPEKFVVAKQMGVYAELERLRALIPLADAACDYADQHCRWFDISTAPKDGTIIQLGGGKFFCEARDCYISEPVSASWTEDFWLMGGTEGGYVCISYNDPTHWRPLPPLPTTPPLPAVFVELGKALERLKEGK